MGYYIECENCGKKLYQLTVALPNKGQCTECGHSIEKACKYTEKEAFEKWPELNTPPIELHRESESIEVKNERSNFTVEDAFSGIGCLAYGLSPFILVYLWITYGLTKKFFIGLFILVVFFSFNFFEDYDFTSVKGVVSSIGFAILGLIFMVLGWILWVFLGQPMP